MNSQRVRVLAPTKCRTFVSMPASKRSSPSDYPPHTCRCAIQLNEIYKKLPMHSTSNETVTFKVKKQTHDANVYPFILVLGVDAKKQM